jgi:hypothetical protein
MSSPVEVVNRPVGGEFQIKPVSHSFYLDAIPLQKYEQDQLAG